MLKDFIYLFKETKIVKLDRRDTSIQFKNILVFSIKNLELISFKHIDFTFYLIFNIFWNFGFN